MALELSGQARCPGWAGIGRGGGFASEGAVFRTLDALPPNAQITDTIDTMRGVSRFRRLACVVLLSCTLAARVLAQTPVADVSLAGNVKDTSGAVMQAVTVRIFAQGSERPILESMTDAQGSFAVALPAGAYRVVIVAPAFASFEQVITLPRREPLNVVLKLGPVAMVVEVTPTGAFGADMAMSLTSTMISGEDLLNLPRNEEELARYLMLLAGADITGDVDQDVAANFVIDGFSGGRLPRADRIAQVIVDPNPMSADGRGGPRIEIVTRPGTGEWRRSVDVGFADASLNARTPGEVRKEPRQRREGAFEIEGPAIPNVLDLRVQLSTETDEQAGESVRAITPAGDVFLGVVEPQRNRNVEVGAQLTLNSSHRLNGLFTRRTGRSAGTGIGGFNLPERGSDSRTDEWMFEAREEMFRRNLANSLRFQIGRNTSRVTPVRAGVAIDVADAFSGGGGTNRRSEDDLRVRIDDNLKWRRGVWAVEWAGRLQHSTRRNIDQDNFNGTFEFASLHDYCRATGFIGVNCAETERIVNSALAQGVTPVYLDARGEVAELTGVPTTYTQASGNAGLEFSELAFDTHVQADRQFGRGASLRLGLRYAATSHSRQWLRLNPTVNFQYRLGATTIVSVGSQLSLDDFRDYERLLRNDGSVHATELSISSPAFPDPFQSAVEIGQDTASLWVLDPDYRSPFALSPRVSVTQQVPGNVRLTFSYAASHGVYQRRTRNINAPYPGTPLPGEILDLPLGERQDVIDRMRPFYPLVGNITQIESTGRSVSRTLTLRVQPRENVEIVGVGLSGSLDYTYRSADDDNDFNNPYVREWGPTRRDHGVLSRFRVALPDEVSFENPVLQALARAAYEGVNLNFTFRSNTGRLYSIRSGRDLNGDQSSTDRPIGVARNSAVGPGFWNLDMTLSKDYHPWARSGEAGGNATAKSGGSTEGPSLRFQASVHNVLNQAQPRRYGSVVTSSLFGLPIGYTGGRTVDLSMSLEF